MIFNFLLTLSLEIPYQHNYISPVSYEGMILISAWENTRAEKFQNFIKK